MFRLCSPFTIGQQVAPTGEGSTTGSHKGGNSGAKYGLRAQNSFNTEHSGINSKFDDINDPELDSYRGGGNSEVSEVRFKPQNKDKESSSFRISSRAKTLRTLEDEIFLLTLDLKWMNLKYAEYEEQLLLATTSSHSVHLCYTCETEEAVLHAINRPHYKSVLVQVLRNTISNKILASNNPQILQALLSSSACLQQLIENYQELPTGFDPSSAYNHNCFQSIEFVFMFADILMAANLKYLIQSYDFQEKHLQCLNAHSNNNNNNNNSNQHSSGSLIAHLQGLLNALNHVIHYTNDKTQTSSLIAYCHCVIKISQVISYIIFILEQRSSEMIKDFSSYFDTLQELVTLVASIMACFHTIKTFLGNESIYYYIFSIRYWHINERMIWLIYYYLNKLSDSHYKKMFILWKQKLFTCIYTILPTPHEFFYELQRMETRTTNIIGLCDDFLFDTMISDCLALPDYDPMDNNNSVGTTSNKNKLQGKDRLLQTLGGNASIVHSPDSQSMGSVLLKRETSDGQAGIALHTAAAQKYAVEMMSFHGRFLLVGMIRMLQLHPPYNITITHSISTTFNYSSAMSVPMREKYFIALYEILSHLLTSTMNKQKNHKPYLLPVFAHLLMKLSIGMDRNPSIDWIFWKLAKELSNFNDYMRRRKSLQALMMRQNQDPSAQLPSYGSYSSRSHDTLNNNFGRPPTHRNSHVQLLTNRSSATAAIDVNMDTPFKDMKNMTGSPKLVSCQSPTNTRKHINISNEHNLMFDTSINESLEMTNSTSNNSRRVSGRNSPTPSFNVGDPVDAQCELENGSKRWFPGTVKEVHRESNAYTVIFDDGDVKPALDACNVRATKQRRKRPTPTPISGSTNSILSAEENHSHAGQSAAASPSLIPPLNFSNKFVTPRDESSARNNASSRSKPDDDKTFFSVSNPTSTDDRDELAPLRSHPHFQKQPLQTIMSVSNISHEDSMSSLLTDDEEVLKNMRNITRVDSVEGLDDEDEDEDDPDCIFEIPSVFESSRAHVMKKHEDFVPKMQLDNLPVSSLPQGVAQASLSGYLVKEESDSMFSSVSPTSFRMNSQGMMSVPSLKFSSSQLQLQPPPRINSQRSAAHSHRSDHDDSSSNLKQHLNLGPRFAEVAPGNGSEEPATGNTRLQSWRAHGDVTGRTTGRSMGTKNNGSNKNLMEIKHTASLSSRSDYHHQKAIGPDEDVLADEDDEFSKSNNIIVQYLQDTFSVIVFILLKYSLLQSHELDYDCCKLADGEDGLNTLKASTPYSASGQQQPALNLKSESTNVLFILREYLELSSALTSKYHIATFSLYLDSGVIKLCKLLSPLFFDTCLKQHIQQEKCTEKIGEGGFGSVFRVTCPTDCNKCHSYGPCYACYQKENFYLYLVHSNQQQYVKPVCTCWKSTRCFQVPSLAARANSSSKVMLLRGNSNVSAGTSMTPPGPAAATCLLIDRHFAVKRIPRERSIHDTSVMFSLFQEISCLEKLKASIGVCGLEDYGVIGSEYWLVMENGKCNLQEWRQNYDMVKRQNVAEQGGSIAEEDTPINPTAPLSRADVILFLVMYLDILLIMRDVHQQDIAHFDIKGSNFILREDPLPVLSAIVALHQQERKASGVVFLADFGESIVNISTLKNPAAVRQKAKGTMCIQSPEMLCISEQSFDVQDSSLLMSYLYSEMSFHDILRTKGSFSRNSFHVSTNSNSRNNSNNSVQMQHLSQHLQQQPGLHVKTQPHPHPILKKKAFSLPDSRSDIWSLGCLLYEIMTGNLLFAEKTWPELYSKFCLDNAAQHTCSPLHSLLSTADAVKIDNIYQKLSDIQNAADADNVGVASGKGPGKGKYCRTLLHMLEVDVMVLKLQGMSPDIQRTLLSILCSAMQPDPNQRVSLLTLIDMVEDTIAMLLKEQAQNASVNNSGTGANCASANANQVVTQQSVVDDLSFSLSISLSGWGNVDKKLHQQYPGPMANFPGTLSPVAALGTQSLSPNASFISTGEDSIYLHSRTLEDHFVALPYSLMLKVTEMVYVTTESTLRGILKQFQYRNQSMQRHHSAHNNSSSSPSSCANKKIDCDADERYLSYYLGKYIHPLDANYKLFQPCYDLMSSIYTKNVDLAHHGGSPVQSPNSDLLPSSSSAGNTLENITAVELFSDLVMYLLQSNTTSYDKDMLQHQQQQQQQRSSANLGRQRSTTNMSINMIKSLKTPIVWIRIQLVPNSSKSSANLKQPNTIPKRYEGEEDETLASEAGIVLCSLNIPYAPQSHKIESRQMMTQIADICNIIHHTTSSRGASPVVIITVSRYDANSANAHPIGKDRDTDTSPSSSHLELSKKHPMVPSLTQANNQGIFTTQPKTATTSSADHPHDDTFCEALSSLEMSFALAIAGFMTHITTKAELESTRMDDAVQLLIRIIRLMPWLEELIDAEILFTFLSYCFRQDQKL